MKKEAILILTIIFLASATYAACDVTTTIDKTVSETHSVSGKDYIIKFVSLKNESGDISVKFSVNGMSTSDLEQGDDYSFDDVSKITIQSISIGSGSVNTSAQICFSAGLIGYGKGTCSTDKECDDKNPCTINECEGDPLRCHRTLILWCRDDDGCCQESRCTPEKDNDCKAAGTPLNISGNITTNESINDSITNQSSTEDTIIVAECTVNKDCDDSNFCTADNCLGEPKICSYDKVDGCNFNGTCMLIGTRIETHFCHTDNTMQQLREKKEYCDNNYECLDNQCIENICKEDGFFKGMINWFKGLFGK